MTADSVAREISRYDPADAEGVSRKIRREAGANQLVSHLIELYREVLDEPSEGSPEQELAAAASDLGSLRK